MLLLRPLLARSRHSDEPMSHIECVLSELVGNGQVICERSPSNMRKGVQIKCDYAIVE